MSGSYDHTVKLWDIRQPETPTTNFNHGCPVESICLLPNGSLLASAGGHEIRIWDLLAGKLLTTLSPHNKTITTLGLSSNGTRLVSGSLDRQVFKTCSHKRDIYTEYVNILKCLQIFNSFCVHSRSNSTKLHPIKLSTALIFRLQF